MKIFQFLYHKKRKEKHLAQNFILTVYQLFQPPNSLNAKNLYAIYTATIICNVRSSNSTKISLLLYEYSRIDLQDINYLRQDFSLRKHVYRNQRSTA